METKEQALALITHYVVVIDLGTVAYCQTYVDACNVALAMRNLFNRRAEVHAFKPHVGQETLTNVYDTE